MPIANPMTDPARPATPWRGGLLIGLAWTAICAWLYAGVMREYYPQGDEWALLASSQPPWANPLSWWHDLSYYFVPGDDGSTGSHFIRPFFNLAYWLQGWFLSPESGLRLMYNFIMAAACAGLVYVCAPAGASGRRGLAALLAAGVPLLPSFLPAKIYIAPCLAFDPQGAACCLLAYLAYQRERYGWAAAALFVAVFTKETSLPVAAAVPATYALANWRALLAENRPRLNLAVLCLPVLAWLVVRAAFGEAVVGGTYALPDPLGALRNSYKMAVRWPFWIEQTPWHLKPGLNASFLSAALFSLLNLASLAAAAGTLLYRLATRSALRLHESGFIASYAFMLLVGTIPRYGCTLQVFLALCIAHWALARPRLQPLLGSAYAAALVAAAVPAWQVYPHDRALQSAYQELAPGYVKLLKSFGPNDRVIVFNDPVTLFSDTASLNRVAGVQAKVDKVAAFVCHDDFQNLFKSCPVQLKPGSTPLSYDFVQACGMDLCGSLRPHDQPAPVPVGDDAQATLLPGPAAQDGQPLWTTAHLQLKQGGVHLISFDPATRSFKDDYVP
jgi:hypothetical protein